MTQHLFVYGTLAPGKENHHQLKGIDGQWQPAKIRGEKRMHDPYPHCVGVDIMKSRQWVDGLLFSSTELVEIWQHLDKFEGPGYKRTLRKVELMSGETVEAYIYAINHKYKNRL